MRVLPKVGTGLEEQAIEVFGRPVGSQVLRSRDVIDCAIGPCGRQTLFERVIDGRRARRVIERAKLKVRWAAAPCPRVNPTSASARHRAVRRIDAVAISTPSRQPVC